MDVQKIYSALLEEFKKTPKNVDNLVKALDQLNEALQNDNLPASEGLNLIYKEFYEITALTAVLKADLITFENAILKVLAFYEVSPGNNENKHLMLGLYLMFLLASKDRLSDFHMVLEKIPQQEQLTNAYINTPVKLEQSLMEGAYNKIVLTEKNVPSPYYNIFIRIMMDAVRETIANSIEKSFKMVEVKVAASLLLFNDEKQTMEFSNKRRWKIQSGYFVFETAPVAPEKQTLDTTRIATQMIYYAKQLEMIV